MRQDLFRFAGSQVPQVAVLIQQVGQGTHTGLIYRHIDGERRLLDFLLDGAIRDTNWRGEYPHVILNCDDDALENLASLCRVIGRRYLRTPPQHLYGFRISPYAFVDPVTGILQLGENGSATCASFVLIVLATARIDYIVDSEDWPYRPNSDKPAYERIITLVDDPQTAERLRSELTSPRIAPEEVAGAGMCPAPPANQQFAERAGKWLLGLLNYNAQFENL